MVDLRDARAVTEAVVTGLNLRFKFWLAVVPAKRPDEFCIGICPKGRRDAAWVVILPLAEWQARPRRTVVQLVCRVKKDLKDNPKPKPKTWRHNSLYR